MSAGHSSQPLAHPLRHCPSHFTTGGGGSGAVPQGPGKWRPPPPQDAPREAYTSPFKVTSPLLPAGPSSQRLAPPGVTKQSWLRTRWKDDWLAAPPSRLHNFIRDPHSVPGLDLPRKQWTTLNRLRTGVGRFSSSMLKWGLKDSSVCECGAPEQTVDHILDVCPQHRPPSGREGIVSLDEDTRAWLASTSLEIWETYARRRKKTISKKTYPLNNGSMAKFFLFWLSHQIFTVEMNPTIWRNQLLKNYVDMWERKGKTGARRLTKQVVTRMNGLESVPNGCISSDTPQKMR